MYRWGAPRSTGDASRGTGTERAAGKPPAADPEGEGFAPGAPYDAPGAPIPWPADDGAPRASRGTGALAAPEEPGADITGAPGDGVREAGAAVRPGASVVDGEGPDRPIAAPPAPSPGLTVAKPPRPDGTKADAGAGVFRDPGFTIGARSARTRSMTGAVASTGAPETCRASTGTMLRETVREEANAAPDTAVIPPGL